MSFLKKLFKRWKSPMPNFFITLYKFGWFINGLAAVLGGLNQIPGFTEPKIIVDSLPYMMAIGTTIIGISKLTVDWDKLPPSEDKDELK
jgi:hypothetical protein